MKKTKTNIKKLSSQNSVMNKIAQQVGTIAGKIVNQKNHLVEMADHAVESVKEVVSDFTSHKKVPAKKTLAKKTPAKKNKPAAKTVKGIVKKVSKATPAKKTIVQTKSSKKAVKKVVKKAAKKAPGKSSKK